MSKQNKKLIKSQDVLDADATLETEIRGEIIGRFVHRGPNRWDDYELVKENDAEVATIGAGALVQLEPLGAKAELKLRARQGRKALLLRWLPTAEDQAQIASGKWGVQEAEQATFIEKIFRMGPENDPRDDMLEYFLEVKSSPYEPDEGMGYLAEMVRRLRGK